MTILVFGGTGSLGRALIRRLSPRNDVHVVSRDEAKHWALRNELANTPHFVRFHVGDVRDADRVRQLIELVDPCTIISAAALKHVDVCESAPDECIKTNVQGVQNIIEAAWSSARNGGSFHTMLQVSTDKACDPINVYGMSKSLAERCVTSQVHKQLLLRSDALKRIRFMAVRYGNVLESRGSIVPLFKWQAEHADAFTVTDPEMTRFLMTLDDSVDLICSTLTHGRNGETWVPKLDAMRIGDLADIFSERCNKPVRVTGFRPGEKRDEALISSNEVGRTTWLHERGVKYVIAPPQNPPSRVWNELDKNGGVGTWPSCPSAYMSNCSVFSRDALEERLTQLGVLDATLDQFKGASTEEIRTVL